MTIGSNGRFEFNQNTIWHSGNFDPGQYFKGKSVGYIYDLAAWTNRATGLYQVHAQGAAQALLKLDIGTGSASGLELHWDYGASVFRFRTTIDSNRFGSWHTIYHDGNLAPATASAAGLMSAEDRIKLNSVASALSLPVVTEDTPTTLEMEAEDAAPVMAVTPQACIRAQRAAQYQMQTDELLYDALEAFARNHPEYSEFAAWLEAKDRIRQEFPKSGATEVADGPETDGEPLTGGPEPAVEQNQKGGGK